MLQDERFAFTLEASGLSVLKTANSRSAEVSHERASKVNQPPPSSDVAHLLGKWGLCLPEGDGATNAEEGLLQRYNYRVIKGTRASGTDGGAAIAPSALRFHEGLADDLLNALFTDPCLQKSLKEANPLVRLSSDSNPVFFERLRCCWTSLSPFDVPLRTAKVVRTTTTTTTDSNTGDSGGSVAAASMAPMPITKRMEEVLPGGVVIADEVRALFLQAHSRPRQRTYGASEHASVDDIDAQEVALVASYDEEEEEEEDVGLWGYSDGAKLSKKELRAVFSADDRREFLFHIVWRLVAGGGAMNQFEDDFQIYKSAARDLYRAMVTSLIVKSTAARQRSNTRSAMDQVDNDGDDNDEEGATEMERRYVPEIASLVFRVTGVRSPPGKQRLSLFPCRDGMLPSNLNYCYVVVNPLQQSVVVWYHGCREPH